MDLSIVIVNFNTRELTLGCLKSITRFLKAKLSFEIIVIDNNSSDGSLEAIKNYAVSADVIHVIEAGSNLGFAKANNAGIQLAKGRQVLLLNSDTYLIDDSLVSAVDYLDRTRNVFGCGCTLLKADQTPGVSYGMFPELFTVCREILTGNFTKLRAMPPRSPGAIYNIDFPCGAFFLIKKDLLDRIGYLDEHFFMYYEETDLAKRAWKSGYRIVYFGPARVVHLGGQSSAIDHVSTSISGTTVDLKKIFYKSWSYYLNKHHSKAYALTVQYIVLGYFKMKSVIFSIVQNKKARALFDHETISLRSGWGGPTP